MRPFLWFLAAMAGTLVLAAALAYPVYLAATAVDPAWAFHKVVTRFWQLTMLAGIAVCVWRFGLTSRGDWGYELPRRRFARQWLAGLAAGLATMAAVAAMMLALGIRAPRPGLGSAQLLALLGSGALSGLLVGLVEETFFRGLLFGAVRRESRTRAAILLTALLYAAVHFLARTRIPAAEVDATSGLLLLSGVLRRFADPAAIADAFLALFAVGVLLGMVRHWTGGIAACIGLHMGWVWVMKATRSCTTPADDARWSFLVSGFDGYTGWMVAGWAALLLAAGIALGWLRPGRDATGARG